MVRNPQDSLLLRLALAATLALAVGGVVLALYQVAQSPEVDPISSEARKGKEDPRLAYCRDGGLATAEDVLCLKAWAENRARFLRGADDTGSVPSDLSPVDGTAGGAVDDEAGVQTSHE